MINTYIFLGLCLALYLHIGEYLPPMDETWQSKVAYATAILATIVAWLPIRGYLAYQKFSEEGNDA